MRMFAFFILFVFIFGCCKNDVVLTTKKCSLSSVSNQNNQIDFYNYFKDSLFEIGYKQEFYKYIKYGKDTLQISTSDKLNNYKYLNYYRKNPNLIEFKFKFNFPFVDSGINQIRLNNGLIISEKFDQDSLTYSYNSDNTIKESKLFGARTTFEYFDIIDNTRVDNTLVILNNFFNLNIVFKLLKKKTIDDNGSITTYNYSYIFDSDKKVLKCIINNKDTLNYSYICN